MKVNLREMPYAQQLEKLRLDGPAGIGPDVLVIPNDQLGGAVVQGLLSPLSVDQAKQDAFTPASINAFPHGQRAVWDRRRWKPRCLSTTRT